MQAASRPGAATSSLRAWVPEKGTGFEGNVADYEADKKRRLGQDADQPHRIKYRKLVH